MRVESQQFADALARSAGTGTDAAQVAEALGAALQDISAALAPIIGKRGVAALWVRSIHLAALTHPWQTEALDRQLSDIDPVQLKSVFAQQSSDIAAIGGGDLLTTFHDLLASLVGASLTERMLRSVWAKLLSGPSAQDTTP
jgi:hypothetical protein